MAKVITFSQRFLQGHPRAGEPTYFVEQVLNGMDEEHDYEGFKTLVRLNKHNPKITEKILEDFWLGLQEEYSGNKIHTIRNGHRFQAGEKASLRVWSGVPYNSPQIIFAPETEVVKVIDFKMKDYVDAFYIDIGTKYSIASTIPNEYSILPMVAKNDGLSLQDFLDWFKYPSPFDGQIICFQDPKY